jgi:3-hydroxyacyl-CoA dehydrogenase
MNEALYVLQEGSATPAEVDAAVVEFGLPMGPFTLFDMTGIDVCAHVNNFLYSQYGPRFEPAKLLDALVAGGYLGQKSGSGFYMHEKGQAAGKSVAKKVNPELDSLIAKASGKKHGDKFEAQRVILPMFNEAVYALQEKVVDTADVDTAMQWGCGMSKGLLTYAEKQGLKWCLEKLEHYQGIHGERFRPSWLLRKMVAAGIRDFSNSEKKPAVVG